MLLFFFFIFFVVRCDGKFTIFLVNFLNHCAMPVNIYSCIFFHFSTLKSDNTVKTYFTTKSSRNDRNAFCCARSVTRYSRRTECRMSCLASRIITECMLLLYMPPTQRAMQPCIARSQFAAGYARTTLLIAAYCLATS